MIRSDSSHTGYVAVLDVLGFTTLVSGQGEDRLRAYIGCVERVTDTAETGVGYAVFSDSIVLTTTSDDRQALHAMIVACSRLLGKMLLEEIPLRGAISHGSFFRSVSNQGVFIAGRPVIDAYQFEQRQDWIGIMLTPSAVRHCPQLGLLTTASLSKPEDLPHWEKALGWRAFVQPCAAIPFHADGGQSSEYSGYAILPTLDTIEIVARHKGLRSIWRKLEWLRSLAPDPVVQGKYKRAMGWMTRNSVDCANAIHWLGIAAGDE